MEITQEEKQPADPAQRRKPTAEELAAAEAEGVIREAAQAARRLKAPIPTAPKVDATAEDTAKDEAAQEAYTAALADAEIALHAAVAEAATLRKAADESRAALDALGPLETDAQRDARTVAAIESDLKRRGLTLLGPGNPTADGARAHIAGICMALLADEIMSDPAGRGYAGKSDQDVAVLVSEAYKDADGNPQTARAAAIFMGIPYAPNAVTTDDIAGVR